MPVESPTPNFFRYRYNLSGPIRSAVRIAPRLLDFASIPVRVRCSTPCATSSWNTWSERCRTGGTVTGDVGVAAPSSIAAAAVMILLVDPGS